MKKKYIAPQSTEVTLFTESLMMSDSNIKLGVDSGKDTPDNWSNKQGWSSENWSESEEEI
mgnify:FL=1